MDTEPEEDDRPEEDEPLDDRSARNLVVGLAIGVEGGLILLALLVGWMLEMPPLARFRFDAAGVLWGLVATVPMLVGFFVAATWPIGPLKAIRDFTDSTIRPLMQACSLLDLLGISVLAGIGEEMLFRGVLQESFRGWMPPWSAVLLAAALFGLLHAVTVTYALLATLIGVFLGLVFDGTDNLLPAIVAHALYDFVALIWVTRGPGSGVVVEEDEQEEQEE